MIAEERGSDNGDFAGQGEIPLNAPSRLTHISINRMISTILLGEDSITGSPRIHQWDTEPVNVWKEKTP